MIDNVFHRLKRRFQNFNSETGKTYYVELWKLPLVRRQSGNLFIYFLLQIKSLFASSTINFYPNISSSSIHLRVNSLLFFNEIGIQKMTKRPSEHFFTLVNAVIPSKGYRNPLIVSDFLLDPTWQASTSVFLWMNFI